MLCLLHILMGFFFSPYIDSISMALSFCSNWGSLEHHFNPDTSSCFQETQPELVFDCNSALANTCVDPVLLQPDDFFYADNCTNQLLPYFSTSPSDYLSQQIFPLDELQYYHKSCGNNYFSNFTPGFFDGYAPNPGLVPESTLPEVVAPLPETAYACGISPPPSIVKKPITESFQLSAQSIAARERRRKITEKTRELGKRIPGGNKMNTAEMFQAAFKYVKYLQAQVAILETIGPIQVI